MRKETNLCMSCMGELNDHGTCPLCGFFDTESYISSYLAPKTFLDERYIVGKLIGYCGESALYIGYDTEHNRKVTIREYMPDTLCVRERGEEQITVKHDKMPLYKTYLAEFAELHSTLMRSYNIRCIQTVLDVFSANNTAYAVMDYIGGISLKAYLTNCGEIMTWEQIKELFPPVLTALSMLHGLGIIHRGISTSTIFVSEKNELRLMSFSISAARTADSEIGYEVFGGFAPPEQYSSTRRNGSWTDVYGISAVLYRCLTGITPPTASERLIEDTLTDPMLINRKIPKNVSDVIMKGMRLEADERISTVTEFVDRLFEQPSIAEDYSAEISIAVPAAAKKAASRPSQSSQRSSESKPQSRPASSKNSHSGKNSKKRKNKADKDKAKFIAAASVLGVIILGFIFAMIYTTSLGDSIEETGEETTSTRAAYTTSAPQNGSGETEPAVTTNVISEGYVLPDFRGAFFGTVSTSNQYSYLIFNATYDFNNELKSGQIIDQDLESGTTVHAGTEINVTVSKGPESLPLPDYSEKTVADYVKELSDMGIKYRIEEEETSETEEGNVVRCSKEIGEMVSVADSEEVVVYSAKMPEETTTEETTTKETEDPFSFVEEDTHDSDTDTLTEAETSDRFEEEFDWFYF